MAVFKHTWENIIESRVSLRAFFAFRYYLRPARNEYFNRLVCLNKVSRGLSRMMHDISIFNYL